MRSAVPAVVVSIMVAPGDIVGAGDTVAVVESMKMEMRLTAPFAGRVRTVFVTPNTQVDAGAPLVQLDAVAHDVVSEADASASTPTRLVRRSHPACTSGPSACSTCCAPDCSGSTSTTPSSASVLGDYGAVCEALPADDPFLTEREEQLLEAVRRPVLAHAPPAGPRS